MIWAAEIHPYAGRYYYFATFTNQSEIIQNYRGNDINRRACHVLVGDSPEGPFYPMQDKTYLPADQPTLDASLWVEDGKPYLVFCHEWLQNWNGTVESIPLKPDLSGTYPEGRRLLFRAFDSPWSREKNENGSIGPNKVTALPMQVPISYQEVAHCLEKSISKIENAVLQALESTPSELYADIVKHGIWLTGGGALLHGLAKRLTDKITIQFHVAEDPLHAVARGTAVALKNTANFGFLIR